MRKSNMRRWFHMAIDFIPLFIIPIYMLYARNENATFNQEVTMEVNKQVDFNQNIENGNFADGTTNFSGNGTSVLSVNNNICEIENNGATYPGILWTENLFLNHKYLLSCDINAQNYLRGNVNGNLLYINDLDTNNIFVKKQVIFELSSKSNNNFIIYTLVGYNFEIANIMLFDLTQMGIEDITIEEFNNYFESIYYPYTESEEVTIENYATETYNDTDVGSQFMYSLYKPIKSMFNISSLPPFDGFYTWLSNTIFGGTAPMPFFIVFNILMYNFIVDLIFLLYSVFMFLIDFCENALDRFLAKGKGC